MSDALVTTKNPITSTSLAARVQALKKATGTFLLLDCSYSMSGQPINNLRRIARDIRRDMPAVRQVIFPANNDDKPAALEIAGDIPDVRGTTPLAEAITYCAGRGALHLIVVSDGEPNDPDAAMTAADAARCQIDVFFAGRAGDPGEAFLMKLARSHGGACNTVSLRETAQLETKIRGLLSA